MTYLKGLPTMQPSFSFRTFAVASLAVIALTMAGGAYATDAKPAEAAKAPVAKTEKPAEKKAEPKKAEEKKKDDALAANTPPAEAWAVRCDDVKDGEKVVGKYCEMAQSISVAKKDADPSTAQRLLEVAIGYPPGQKGKAAAIAILPLGVLVNEDIVVDLDGSKLLDFKIRHCLAAGCVGAFTLSEKDIKKMSEGKALTVKSVTADNRPLAIELSLNGFGKAYDKIKPTAE